MRHALLFSLTLTGFQADQQVERTHGAKGDLLGQVVDREGSSVAQHHCLAQQGSGRAHLELLPLQNDIKFRFLLICYIYFKFLKNILCGAFLSGNKSSVRIWC